MRAARCTLLADDPPALGIAPLAGEPRRIAHPDAMAGHRAPAAGRRWAMAAATTTILTDEETQKSDPQAYLSSQGNPDA